MNIYKAASFAIISSVLITGCGGGGGGSPAPATTSTPANQGGNNQNPPTPPSQNSANALQANSLCTAPAYAASTVGSWVMAMRGASGANTATRGAVCRNANLDTAAQSVTSGTSLANARSLATAAGFTGTVLDYAYETATSVDLCAEKLNYKMKSMLVQGRLTDVGTQTSGPDGSGNYTCAAIAASKSGAGVSGQIPSSTAIAYAHFSIDNSGGSPVYNYPHAVDGSTANFVDVDLSSASVADACASGGACLPQLGSVVITDGYGQANNVLSKAAEAATYSGNGVITQNQTIDNTMDKTASTVRYWINSSCGPNGALCTMTLTYMAGGTQHQLITQYADTHR
jgi:hypothetical protein